MIALLATIAVALGLYWLYTALAYEWRGFGFGPKVAGGGIDEKRVDVDAWLTQAGLEDVDKREFVAVVVMLFVLGAAVGFAIFAGPVPAIVVGGFAGVLFQELTKSLKYADIEPGHRIELVYRLAVIHGHSFLIGCLMPIAWLMILRILQRLGAPDLTPDDVALVPQSDLPTAA